MKPHQRPILSVRSAQAARVRELQTWVQKVIRRGLVPLALVAQGDQNGKPGTFVFSPDAIPDRAAVAVALRNMADFLLGIKPPVKVDVVEAPKGG